MQRYEERLTAYQSVDFDDLIGLPLKLLRDHPEVRAKWQQQLGHVLVDEYQDTNATQYELLKLLVGERGRFHRRGRRRPVHLRLARRHAGQPEAPAGGLPAAQGHQAGAELPLHQRHPARGQQRDRAQPQAVPKTLWSELGEGEPVRVVDADSEEHEAERAVARIQSLRAAGRRRQPAAGLARLRHPVPRQPPGQGVRAGAAQGADPVQGVGRPELLRPRRDQGPVRLVPPVVNNDDDPAFLRAITTPKRGIGHTTLGSWASLPASTT
jgi:ATP-dependent DNA helicase Rep